MTEISKISLRNLQKRFGEKVVLNGVDLDIAPGDSMVVIGSSGTGKSVMLKCILGLLKPDGGTIQLDGNDIGTGKGLAERLERRRIADHRHGRCYTRKAPSAGRVKSYRSLKKDSILARWA